MKRLNRGKKSSAMASVARIFVGVVAWLVLSPSAWGLGFRIPNQDAEATARGNAFIATADNPSAVYYNPAGITQIKGFEGQFGVHTISVNSQFEPAGGGPGTHTEFEIQPVPEFFAVYTPDQKPYSFGLGAYAPFGLGLQWPRAAPFHNMAGEGRLQYLTFNPVLAWEILPGLSLAAGPTIDVSSVMLRRGIGLAPGDEFHFRGQGTAFGAKAGLRWQPHEKWVFGVSYFSPTEITYSGNSGIKPLAPGEKATTVSVPFPQYVMAGISFRPNHHWNLEVGVDWTDWDTLNTVVFKGTAVGNAPFPLNWKSSYLAHIGATRYLPNNWWVAAGYFFSQNSTSDKDFNPIVPDTDLHVGSLGFGHRGQRWDWALSGQIIGGPARRISNGNAADGTYQFFNQAVNVSLARHF